MSKRMQNKVVLVSGAGSIGPGWGNGKASSVLYAREGATVLACDINLKAANETVKIIEKEGGNAISFQCDVSNSNSIKKLFDKILKKHDKIDVLHSNVGIVEVGGPEEITEKNWDKLIDTNVKSLDDISMSDVEFDVSNVDDDMEISDVNDDTSYTLENLKIKSLKELKTIAQEVGIKPKGNKNELINGILNA